MIKIKFLMLIAIGVLILWFFPKILSYYKIKPLIEFVETVIENHENINNSFNNSGNINVTKYKKNYMNSNTPKKFFNSSFDFLENYNINHSINYFKDGEINYIVTAINERGEVEFNFYELKNDSFELNQIIFRRWDNLKPPGD